MTLRNVSHAGSSGGANGSMPHNIVGQNSRLMQHAISSMLLSSGLSTGNGLSEEEERRLLAQRGQTLGKANGELRGHHGTEEKEQHNSSTDGTAKKFGSLSSNGTHQLSSHNQPSNDFHVYYAPSLPDPLLPEPGDSSRRSSDTQEGDLDNCVMGKHMCTDSSSGKEEKAMMSSNNDYVNPERRER